MKTGAILPILILLVLAGCSCAQKKGEWALSTKNENWVRRLQLDDASVCSEDDAAELRFEPVARYGRALLAGRFYYGSDGARLEYRDRLPLKRATVRGFYRTEGIEPYCAEVSLTWGKGEVQLGRDRRQLGASPAWRPFTLHFEQSWPKADGASPAFGVSHHTAGRVFFAGLRVSEKRPKAAKAKKTELERFVAPRDFEEGDQLRLGMKLDTHWFVDRKGRGFFLRGCDAPTLPAAPNGSDEAAALIKLMREHGFRGLGRSGDDAWLAYNHWRDEAGKEPQRQLLSTDWKGVTSWLVDARGEPGAEPIPDPFNPLFEAAFRTRVTELAKGVKKADWILGWVAAPAFDRREIRMRLSSASCQKALQAYLEERRGGLEDVNDAWGTEYASFDELLSSSPRSELAQGKMHEDLDDFAATVSKRLLETCRRVVKEVDPGRTLFSPPLRRRDLRHWYARLEDYRDFDGVAIEFYPQNVAPGLGLDERELFERIYLKTRRPVLVTAWSLPALDSGLYATEGPGRASRAFALRSQNARAKQAGRVLADLFNLPFVVGAIWSDWSDSESDNHGLFAVSGEPWKALMRTLRRSNRDLERHGR